MKHRGGGDRWRDAVETLRSFVNGGSALTTPDRRVTSPRGRRLLDRLRRLCDDFPGVEEGVDGFGCTTFKVRGKSFARVSQNDASMRLTLKADPDLQDILVDGRRYFKAPYIGRFGWIAVDADQELDWNELSGLIAEAYASAAPKGELKP